MGEYWRRPRIRVDVEPGDEVRWQALVHNVWLDVPQVRARLIRAGSSVASVTATVAYMDDEAGWDTGSATEDGDDG